MAKKSVLKPESGSEDISASSGDVVFGSKITVSGDYIGRAKERTKMTKKRTAAKKNKAESGSGNINISGSIKAGGHVVTGDMTQAGGNIAGRDMISTHTGVKGDEVAKLFEQVSSAIKQQAPAEKRAEAGQKVAELQEQVRAKQPDVGLVGKTLKWLKKNVPGVSSTLSTVLSQPIIGQGIKDIAAVILEDDED